MHRSEVGFTFEVVRTKLCWNLLRRSTVSICTDVGSFIESKTTVVQTLNVGFTSEVSDYIVVHMGPGVYEGQDCLDNCTYCQTDIEVTDQTHYLAMSVS